MAKLTKLWFDEIENEDLVRVDVRIGLAKIGF